MIQAAHDDKRARPRAWPDLMKLTTAARALDMDPSTFRPVAYVLAAHYGLTIYQFCGQRVRREQLVKLLDRLANEGRPVRFDKDARVVHVGQELYPLKPPTERSPRKGVHHATENEHGGVCGP